MGDFLLDLRPPEARTLARTAADLRFSKHLHTSVEDRPAFGLVLTHSGLPSLWATYQDASGSLFAVAGMAAFDDREWMDASRVPGPGGLAAKILAQSYARHGRKALEQISGNCAVLAFDATTSQLHLVADCGGAFPTFECETSQGWVFGSHPDVVASTAGEQDRLNEDSLAEFLLSSTVTPPFTYYQRVRSLANGTSLTFDLRSRSLSRRQYFKFEYRGDNATSEHSLAEELAAAFRRSVQRRTQSRLGPTAVALSGGLDSRALLACIENSEHVFSFCLFNEINFESRTAESIASSLNIRFLPYRREFEYYGDNAAQGVRISGGMGTFANNHFLGALDRLREEGMQNLLTGCYCDYLFKGLPLNRRSHWLTGREELAPFQHEFYFSHQLPGRPVPPSIRDRWESRVPLDFQRQESPATTFQVEARRTFPLCYEGDNQQRVVPQRLTGWYLPVAEREILDLYCRIPYQLKLNRSLFLRTVRNLSPAALLKIPDANTGARVGASRLEAWFASNRQRLRRKLRRTKSSIATEESWPNWRYYVAHSQKLADLWKRPNPQAFDLFSRVVGSENVHTDVKAYEGNRLFLFVSLLSLKLWFENRVR
jgi:asparagine synthase (glutamine-hydrolysing)